MAAETKSLFVTKVYDSAPLPPTKAEAILQDLEGACAFIASEDRAGQQWSQAKAYKGYTSYGSLTDLTRRANAFADLKKILDSEIHRFADALAFDLGGRRLKLDHMWINILKPGGGHTGHIHPLSVISGTFYVATPEGSGALKLEDPRLSQMMAAPPRRADAEQGLRPFIYLHPEAGRLFLWESWLRHEVEPNRARSPRVSISFNYGWG